MQRFLRLRCEIGELMDDLDSMAESTRESSHSEGLSIQVKTLSKQLEACQVDSEVDTGSSGNVGVDALAKQIDALKKTSSSKAAEDDGSGVYQVFLTSENQGTIDVADLDARLVALELWPWLIATAGCWHRCGQVMRGWCGPRPVADWAGL